uniref:hypothetical protein n=1 Tax=Paractinoplanes polyasparticus TaxID=2856853 RepID=UPI001C851400|nr:hypothetical protein [Actinoplanes polyasparticus]
MKTVAQLRADVDHHRRWYPSNALGTADEAVTVLERLTTAAPHEVFALLDELRGTTTSSVRS